MISALAFLAKGVALFAAVSCAASAFGAAPTPKVARVEKSLPVANVTGLGGFVGQRYKLNDTNRLSTFDIDRFVRMLEDKRYTAWFWLGEQPGKWLEASVLSSSVTGDAQLRAKAEKMLSRMVAAQEPSGYLGITDPAVRTAEHPIRGMDPYELYFTLHGLMSAYEDLGSKPALDSARKLADFFVERFGPGKVEFWPDMRTSDNPQQVNHGARSFVAGHTVHRGLEGTLLTDPIMRLYGITGDKTYLDWSQTVVANIDRWSGFKTFSNLDLVADGKMGIDKVQPYVHAHTFQMNFLAFLQLYEQTGDKSYLRKVVGSVKDIIDRQMYITGAVSVGEHYSAGHDLPNAGNVAETCASMSWMELCQSLLELTGDPMYADAMERLMLNHVFAAQTSDGDGFRYHTPLNGTKPYGYWTGPDCCSSSGARIIAKLPTFIYASGAEGVYVNQFVQSTAKLVLPGGKSLQIAQETSYPESEKVAITVTPAAPVQFVLHVRLPGWCSSPALAVNGKAVAGLKPGTYATVRRTWKKGDKVVLTLPMEPKWVKGEYTSEGLWCLTRGPVVYMLDSVWYTPEMRKAANGARDGDEPAYLGGVKIDQKLLTAGIERADAPAGTMGPAYRVPLVLLDGSESKALMVPFANVGRWYVDPSEPKDPKAASHGYAVWVADSLSPALQAAVEQNESKTAYAARIVDEVEIDNPASHNPGIEGSQGGVYRGRAWRGSLGGWLSWDLKVLPNSPVTLLCTFWGDEQGNRNFDVLVDGRKLGTMKLLHNQPGKFFSVEYPIPQDVTKGKNKVTVKFQSVDGAFVGGVFGCAILKPEAAK